MENKNEKWVQYATLISSQIGEMFNEEGSNHIDASELAESDNIKAFLHALATVVPANFFNKLTGDKKNHIEFNHLANLLCFEFSKNEQ